MGILAYGVAAATLLASCQAAPSSSLGGIPGLQLSKNAQFHGPVWNSQNFSYPDVSTTNSGRSHNIAWPKVTTGWINWSTYKSNGANVGGWLEQEFGQDDYYWNKTAPSYNEEWSWCQAVGLSVCGPILEKRFASFFTTADVDKLAAVGVNTLRIPTTYAAWVKVPGSYLYSGNQQTYIRRIANYAIEKHGMHVILGLHSLPGGTNSLEIGEAFGHKDWFNNSTNLAYSFAAVDAILAFMKSSGHIQSFSLAPLNEASDNLAGFATTTALSENGANWVLTYINGCLKRVAAVDKRIPLLFQDCFKGETYWSPLLNGTYPTTNVVIDTHIYYFAVPGTTPTNVPAMVCSRGKAAAGDSKFPVFIGEWSLQTLNNNTLAQRKTLFDTQRYAWQAYASGGAFWTAQFNGTTAVNGEGTQRDYWGYERLIDQGVITSQTDSSYC